MIGELDYAGLFYGEETETESVFSGFVMLALAVFVVFIVLLLVNFLIGLAAEEIRVCSTQYLLSTNRITDCCDFVVNAKFQDFYERAEIWKLCTELEQIVMLESFLDESVTCFGRDFLKRYLMLMPPLWDAKAKQFKQRYRLILNTVYKGLGF
jgi:hypothetical protein